MKQGKATIRDAIFGLSVGDALGVPVEFYSRQRLEKQPVTGMQEYGCHHQPAGTWSDDTSMSLCLLDSLSKGVDYDDIMHKFKQWAYLGKYTAHGKMFGIGRTCAKAIFRFSQGTPALDCGGKDENENGNGSLMRILPLSFWLYSQYGLNIADSDEAMQIVHNISALTHAHPRSQFACGIYLIVACQLLGGQTLLSAIGKGVHLAEKYYSRYKRFSNEMQNYKRLLSGELFTCAKTQIKSSGYVIDTLESALWCLYKTHTYEECVLQAVNLGGDTDTIAATAGGLAGMYYGKEAVPAQWLDQLAKREEIIALCDNLQKNI